MLGMFHYAKVFLRCAGRYLSGSGVEDALIESEVFGKKVALTSRVIYCIINVVCSPMVVILVDV